MRDSTRLEEFRTLIGFLINVGYIEWTKYLERPYNKCSTSFVLEAKIWEILHDEYQES